MKQSYLLMYAALLLGSVSVFAQGMNDIVPVYWMDDFNDNQNGWNVDPGGHYQITLKQKHLEISNGSLGSIQSWPRKYTFPEGTKYGIEMRYIITQNYANGSVSLRCGMANKGKNYISFTVNEEKGTFKISAFKGEKGREKELTKWKPASFLNKGGYNVLGIERDGDVATFRLNGKVLKVLKGMNDYWLGDLITMKAPSKTTVMFDAIAIYGYHNLTAMERTKFSPLLQKHNNPESYARDFAQWADNAKTESELTFAEQVTAQSAKDLFINFQPLRLPYQFDYERSQGRDITQFVGGGAEVYLIGELAECSDKKVALIMRRYMKNGSDITRFIVQTYGIDGRPDLSSKELAINVKENGGFYKLSQWKVYESNNQVILESSTKVNTGSVSNNKITVNRDFCAY